MKMYIKSLQNRTAAPTRFDRARFALNLSLGGYVALILAAALLFAALPLHIGAQAQGKRSEQSLSSLIGLLLEADAFVKDAKVHSDLKQASEAASRAKSALMWSLGASESKQTSEATSSAQKAGEGNKEAAQEMQKVLYLLRRIDDSASGESSEFQEKISTALKLALDEWETPGVDRIEKIAGAGAAEAKAKVTEQPDNKISPAVLAAFQQSQEESGARAETSRQSFAAYRARFGPMATALAEALKVAGVDLDGYLAASKQLVETPPEKVSKDDVDRVNRKFAEPIRAAIAKTVGVPGVGDLLQSVQPGQSAPGAPGKQNHSTRGRNGIAGLQQQSSCCSTTRFEPPFEGLYTEDNLRTSRRAGITTQLTPMVRTAIVGAPYEIHQSGRTFTVPATARRVVVTANLGTRWLISLAGLGYAHVWLGLDMKVSDASGLVRCNAPHLEQDNRWTWAGGGSLYFDRRSGLNITRTCEFDRNPGDPTDYAAMVSASSNGTFIGFSGGYGYYTVDLGPVDVCA